MKRKSKSNIVGITTGDKGELVPIREEEKITKEMAVDMLMNIWPNSDLHDHPLISTLGKYIKAPGVGWLWNVAAIKKLPKDKILTVYHLCKNSWNE